MTAGGGRLATGAQVRQIEALAIRIGVPATTDGIRALQGKVGGSSQPYAYRLMSRDQAASFIETLWDFVRERERATDVREVS
jgi:hypothetical protein